MDNLTCYHPPPGQPLGHIQPFGPGSGEMFEAVLSEGLGGVGQIKKNFFLILHSTRYFSCSLQEAVELEIT